MSQFKAASQGSYIKKKKKVNTQKYAESRWIEAVLKDVRKDIIVVSEMK